MLSKLPNKTLLEILYRLTPVGLLKIRSISKTLSNLTKQCFFIAKYLRINTVTGFFYQEKACSDSKQLPDKPSFIPIEPQEGRLPDPHLNFLKQKNKIVQIQVIDSCNDGLLLCSGSRVGRSGLDKTWFVCNPLTMEKLALPHPRRQSCKSIYALVADFTSSGYLEFKVLCLFGPKKGDPNSKLSIFSLETGEWEEVEECPPPLCDKFSMGSKVFFNGRLLWDCLQDQILICHLNSKNQKCPYELLEAPQAPLGRCLWGFEDKLRCYCHGFPDEFPAWSIRLDDDKNEPKWELEDCEEFENLNEDICRDLKGRETTNKPTPQIRFKILQYAPESQKIFLSIPNSVYSYELRNRSLELCACKASLLKFHSTSRLLP